MLEMLGSVILLGVVGFVFFWYEPNQSSRKNTIQNPVQETLSTSFEDLLRTNDAFAEGERYVKAGNYTEAITAYTRALNTVSTPNERGQTEFKIASAMVRTQDPTMYLSALKNYMAIAANTSFSSLTRAYAVQDMGLLFYRFSDPRITEVIFAEAPYAELSDPDTAIAYRKLFEYASSIYPLALSEIRIADWYATQLFEAQHTNQPLKSELTDEYKKHISERLQSAQIDEARARTSPNEGSVALSALTRRAVLAGKMQYIGETQYGNFEELFTQAIQIGQLAGSDDGYARALYAYYLLEVYGPTRSVDAARLTEVFSSGAYASKPVMKFFANERTNTLDSKKIAENT
jgi:hypothetical protein